MIALAEHIIQTKAGEFKPKAFDERYEAASAELVQAKIEGRSRVTFSSKLRAKGLD